VTERKSLVDKLREEHPLDMAAAGAAVSAVAVMNKATAFSGVTREEIADELGIPLERVDEVLDGDGNVRVSTLARFLHVAGYQLKLVVSPRKEL
jgi:DNA-binding phage protein